PPGFWEPGAAERFVRAVESVDPTAAGHGLSVYHHSEMIRTDFIRATLWAVLAVLLVLLVTFRNALDTMLAVLPVVIGWSWMIGCLALLGLSFNAANIVVLPLVLGIGVDAGVHMVHRARSSAQRLGRTRGDLAEVIGGTG